MHLNNPLPRLKAGIKRRIHSITRDAVTGDWFGLLESLPISSRINATKGPAKPIKKLKIMTNKLHIDGEENPNDTQYVNPADAGPKSTSVKMTPPTTPRVVVVNVLTPNANMRITVDHIGIW